MFGTFIYSGVKDKNMIFYYSYRLMLFFLAVLIWILMYWAYKSDYDENYGYYDFVCRVRGDLRVRLAFANAFTENFK